MTMTATRVQRQFFVDEALRPGVYGVAIFTVLALLYFFLHSRHHLVAAAPEEEIALVLAAEDELAHK